MHSSVHSSALRGIEATLVEVEVDLGRGLPGLQIVGLPEAAVRESRERVRAAIVNSGYEFPKGRTTINLAPADLRKEGSAYDLPIAVGLLAAARRLSREPLGRHVLLGELALDGRVKPVRGALSIAGLVAARRIASLILPSANAAEAALVRGVEVFGVASLADAVEHLAGRRTLAPCCLDVAAVFRSGSTHDIDLAEVRGQAHARRALEVAAAGGHNLLFVGPPGSGKTMLSRRLATVLPEMTLDEAIETTRIHSVAGLLDGRPMIATRPFRAPHHTVSDAGLVGGGPWLRPGEASLAHNGVLFLDELPEYRRNVLEALRQPLEDRRVALSRAQGSVSFPASFLLAAAMNPCRCGYHGDPRRECSCTSADVRRYRARVSGPLLDRLDIQIEVPAVSFEDLAAASDGEPSAAVRARVNRAREIQRARLSGRRATCNAEMGTRDLRRFCSPDDAGKRLLEAAVTKLGLSARAYARTLRLARTIADLAGARDPGASHVAEAIQYRALDRREE